MGQICTACKGGTKAAHEEQGWVYYPGWLGANLLIGSVSTQLLHGLGDDRHGMVNAGNICIPNPCTFAPTFHIVKRALEAAIFIYDFLQGTNFFSIFSFFGKHITSFVTT